MFVSPARAAAFEILLRIETTDAFASELLHSARRAKLSPADHGLLTELVMGVLRWRGGLDDKIAEYSTQSMTKLDLEVLTALRLGAYQLLFLDRVPRHAAVNESVELVKIARKRSAAGLVNAVLRKIQRAQFELYTRSAHPHWLVERWERIYGVDVTRRICEYDQSAPQPAVRVGSPHPSKIAKGGAASVNPHPSKTTKGGAPLRFEAEPWSPSSAFNELHAEGLQLEPGRLLTKSAIVTAGDIARTSAFLEHRLSIQDEASQLVALLVGTGKATLDCCAAPGGKTRIMAEQNPDATVFALELHPHRAALLKKLVCAPNVLVVAADARQMPFARQFDRILVDAPCSGTGTLARNPEIKWRLTPDDITRLQSYQIELLTSAMDRVAEGGRILYSTCSLEPEENQRVIEQALSLNPSLRLLNCRDELLRLCEQGELAWSDMDSLLDGPYLRTIPGIHPCDGFFASILEKR